MGNFFRWTQLILIKKYALLRKWLPTDSISSNPGILDDAVIFSKSRLILSYLLLAKYLDNVMEKLPSQATLTRKAEEELTHLDERSLRSPNNDGMTHVI